MKRIQKPNNSTISLLLKKKENAANISQVADANSIRQERLRQSRIKFNLASTLIGVSASFCFTAVALFWVGKLSEQATIRTVDLVSRVVTSYCLPLIKSSQRQLDELTNDVEDDTF
jgi:hypothetical protein